MTHISNAKAILDALADAAGKPARTNEQALRIVENFIGIYDGLTNEQKAQNFNVDLYKFIRWKIKNNAEARKEAENDADVEAAGASALGDL